MEDYVPPGMESNKVKLISSDNVTREVDACLLQKSIVLKDNKGGEEVILNGVDAKNLDLIIKYLEHYKDMEPKEIPKPFPEVTDETFFRGILNDNWTFDCLKNISLEDAIDLVNAANHLQMDGLVNILSAKLAYEMCNCDPEEAKQKFGIQTDLTDEEIAELDKYPLD